MELRMNQQERGRIRVLGDVIARRLKQNKALEILGISTRPKDGWSAASARPRIGQ